MMRSGCVFVGMTAVLAGCAIRADSNRSPVRWQLVEKRYSELEDGGVRGDGRVDPDATTLLFQPLYPEDLSTEIYVGAFPTQIDFLGISHQTASLGTEATARVRVHQADPTGFYRLTARASKPTIRILGKDSIVVRGSNSAVFRFTSTASGSGGVTVIAERVR